MKVIILAGGRAVRLPVSAKNIPKVLVEINKKPILRHQIEALEKQGFSDICFSLGYMAEQIIKYLDKEFKGKYEYIVEKEPLGTGGAILRASRGIKSDFLVLNGDILSDLDIRTFYDFHNSLKEENRAQDISAIALWRSEDSRDFGLVKTEGDKIKEFLEKPKNREPGFINAGAYIFSPLTFKNLSQKVFSVESEIFPNLARQGKLYGFIHNGKWLDVGTEQRLKQAQKYHGIN